QGLCGRQGPVHSSDRRGDQIGQAREHQDDRYRALRSRGGDRPPLLGQPLLSGAGRRPGRGGLRRHPRGHAIRRQDRPGPRRPLHAGAPAGVGAARSRHPRLLPSDARR
ncbi:hypothetical protein LTR94_034699, partial [Friedmanniomyces endolithicus]